MKVFKDRNAAKAALHVVQRTCISVVKCGVGAAIGAFIVGTVSGLWSDAMSKSDRKNVISKNNKYQENNHGNN